MSFQAVTWAIEQRAGSPSAKAVLWSIANYANDQWVAWPKQATIANDSEQSTDSVGKRVADLIELGLARRIKLKRYGRRVHDFMVLRPSPLFEAPLEVIRQHLPAGCDVLEDAAADGGSVQDDESATPQSDSESDATASSGSVLATTLPQSAVDATALVRQHEPITNPQTLPQTPSQEPAAPQGQATEEAAAGSGVDLTGLDLFKSTYPLPCSDPEKLQTEWGLLNSEERTQCQYGATGVAEFLRKTPKARGIVGPLRFVRSSALWGEFSRFAPAPRSGPTPRVWVEFDSEEWRARAVLCGIIGQKMATAVTKTVDGDTRKGADFLGHLPPAGLALAQFTDQFGNVDTPTWVLLAANPNRDRKSWTDAEVRDHPHVAAWIERVSEICGVRLAPGLIDLGGTKDKEVFGKIYKFPNRMNGLRVPAPWPPSKGNLAKTG